MLKKIFSLLALIIFSLSLIACAKKENKLIVWSFTDELKTQGDIKYWEDKYSEKYNGMKVEYVIIPTDDYLSKILPVLKSGKGAPDVFTGELDMIMNFMEAGYYADLEQMMKSDEDVDFDYVKSDFIPYVWESGKDKNGVIRALSWQSTPGAIFFRADLANLVWPNWDAVTPSVNAPADVAKDSDGTYKNIYDFMSYEKFNSVDQLVITAQEVVSSNKNIKLFPNEESIRFFAAGSDQKSWIKGSSLNPERIYDQMEYMKAAKQFYGTDLSTSFTANAGEWSGEWFSGMQGPVKPVGSDVEYQIMAYSLPTWGLFSVIEPNSRVLDENGNVIDTGTYGEWRAASGPNSYFWGGTFLGVYSKSDNKEAAYDFVKSLTLDTERMYIRAKNNGDVYSRISVMERIAEEAQGYDLLGGQNHFDYFLPAAQNIDVSIVTKYDRALDTMLGKYVNEYKKGDITMEQALEAFYKEVRTTYGNSFAPTTLPKTPRSS